MFKNKLKIMCLKTDLKRMYTGESRYTRIKNSKNKRFSDILVLNKF
jgi:hypothetical protein